MEDITFTVEDILPEDSLLRPLMHGLWGDVTMKFSNSYYHLENYPINFTILVINDGRKITMQATMRVIFIRSEYREISISSNPDYNKIGLMLFNKCLLETEDKYQYVGPTHHEVRKYPIYQMLENSSIAKLLNYSHISCSWKGFILNVGNLSVGVSIAVDGKRIYYAIIKDITILMDEMKAGTADPILYSGFSIGTKSARKTE